jgi:hypothetical protein
MIMQGAPVRFDPRMAPPPAAGAPASVRPPQHAYGHSPVPPSVSPPPVAMRLGPMGQLPQHASMSPMPPHVDPRQTGVPPSGPGSMRGAPMASTPPPPMAAPYNPFARTAPPAGVAPAASFPPTPAPPDVASRRSARPPRMTASGRPAPLEVSRPTQMDATMLMGAALFTVPLVLSILVVAVLALR